MTMAAPATLLLDASAVARLNWQPRLCPPPLPCIASRIGDMLELVFGHGSGRINATRHRYRLEPTDKPEVLRAVNIDTEAPGWEAINQ